MEVDRVVPGEDGEVVLTPPVDDFVDPEQAALMQNQARSTVSCTGTVWPTPTAE